MKRNHTEDHTPLFKVRNRINDIDSNKRNVVLVTTGSKKIFVKVNVKI